MTINEAAALLGLTPDTLQRQAQRGILRATKRGRDWWVTEGAVEEYRREHQGRLGRPPGRKAK